VVFGKPIGFVEIDIKQKPDSVDGYQFFADELREKVKLLSNHP
jgi:hypothetical protein